MQGESSKVSHGPQNSEVREWIKTHFSLGWADEASQRHSSIPSRCFVAVQESPDSGFRLLRCHGRAFFGPTGVDETNVGKGIGKALLMHTLKAMYGGRIHLCHIGGVGPDKFYASCCGRATMIEGVISGMVPGISCKLRLVFCLTKRQGGLHLRIRPLLFSLRSQPLTASFSGLIWTDCFVSFGYLASSQSAGIEDFALAHAKVDLFSADLIKNRYAFFFRGKDHQSGRSSQQGTQKGKRHVFTGTRAGRSLRSGSTVPLVGAVVLTGLLSYPIRSPW